MLGVFLVIKISRAIAAGDIRRTTLKPWGTRGPQLDIRKFFAPATSQSTAVSPYILPK